jgi:LacI family transcriptional regulator
MGDVAQKAGVSITTVSHVINKTRRVNQETKDSVLRAIEELNYQTSKMQKPSGAGSNPHIGVILADVREDYYIEMIKILESLAADYGIPIIFCDSEDDSEKEKKNIAMLIERNVNGILLAPAAADDIPEILKMITIPVVLIDRQYDRHKFLFVGINNFYSSLLGTRYLFGKGCARIGFIGYKGSVYTITQRIFGYKSALAVFGAGEYGKNPETKILLLNYNSEDSFPLIKKFILDEHLDGLICATSCICYEVIDVIDHLDERVRESIKIISYDDNRWADFLRYRVSTIAQPVAEIGNAALEALLQAIEHPGSERPLKRELLFDTAIIDRIPTDTRDNFCQTD